MSRRVSISDEVRALFSTATIERLLAQREHTELTCVICRGTVPPEAPDVMSVLVRFDVADRHIVQWAHESCAPSHVDRSAVVVAPDDDEQVIYVPALLVRQRVRAALIWEPRRPTFDMSRLEAVAITVYRDLGFAASDAGLAAIYGPTPAGLVLRATVCSCCCAHTRNHLKRSATSPPLHRLAGSRQHDLNVAAY